MALGHRFAEFIDACHRVGALGLVRCNSGNMSWRVDEGRVLATASRSWLGHLGKENVTLCRLSDGAVLRGPKPTVELGFHLGILRARPDVDVVLHCQTPFATTLACMNRRGLNYYMIPEVPYYIGPIGDVPYLDPGSAALADAVVSVMRTHNLAVMGNYGQVTVGKTFDNVMQNASFFELACEIIVRSGGKARPISEEGVRYLRPSCAKKAGKAV